MDIWDKEKRSQVMSKIRSKNTKPEIALRKALFARGFRFRVNDKRLPGTPDIVLPKYKTIIFVHGCFWHAHQGCKYGGTPKTNTKFWTDKFTSNRARDKVNAEKLVALGWNVLTVWECEIQYARKQNISQLINELSVKIIENRLRKISVKLYEERNNQPTLVAEEVIEYRQRTGGNSDG